MNKRLKTISNYIDDSDKVIDVGCDLAFLSIILAKRGIFSSCSDIKDTIIKNAKNNVKKYKFEKYVTFYVGDGLNNIPNKYDTLVISGMGTFNIINIIKSSNNDFKKVILVSNNDYYLLRKSITELGYIIENEEIIKDKNKYYNLIMFIKGNKKYDYSSLLLGINHKNIVEYKSYLRHLLKKYKLIYEKNNNENIKKHIKIIKNKILSLKES